MTYILIIYFYAGVFAKGDSVAIDHIGGFTTQEQCIAAGEKLSSFVRGTTKEYKFECVWSGQTTK